MLENPAMYASVAAATFSMIWNELRIIINGLINRRKALWFGSTPAEERTRNIVIIGASFAGYDVGRILVNCLPPKCPYRIVVIEPSSHFVFTWVLPRFCVAKGHEDKAFIPYGGYTSNAPEGALRWVKDRVVEITKESVKLEGTDEEIPYEYLVIATGSDVKHGLPSRVHQVEKIDAVKKLQEMQQNIEKAKNLVVVGGGAAGVEVATDAKSLYPDKNVTLVHSRSALMHRFGAGLQKAALEGMNGLGGEVILEDRVVEHDASAQTVTLKSGRILECDCLINCIGQKPRSDLIAKLSPSSISSTGHIKVKPNLQIDDDELPNIFVCGDVADTKTPNPNARAAISQSGVVAQNILQLTQGQRADKTYQSSWAEGFIKLTLGLDRSVTHLGDGKTELLFRSVEKKVELMAGMCWKRMGQKPYEDHYMKTASETSKLDTAKE